MDKSKKKDTAATVREYLAITFGIFLAAFGIYFFMLPGHIVLGSITGLGMVLVNLIPIPLSAMTFILNAICLVIGFVLIGKEFGAKTFYTSMALPAFFALFEFFFPNNQSLTNDLVLDLVCSILILSVGQSIMFHANASSGGLDIIAKIMNKYLHIELGKGVAIAGVMTVATTIFVYDIKTLVVGILGTYINGLVLDEFIAGFSRRKRVCILSQNFESVSDYIKNQLNRGVTLYEAFGGYNQNKKTEVVTILAKNEYMQLMDYIRTNDPTAFVTVSAVSEIAGSWNTKHGVRVE